MKDTEMSSIIDSAGPITGLFILLLAIGIFVIWKSMNRQMKRIDPDLPMGPDDREQAADRMYTEEAIANQQEQEG
jgi:hypothetical protein